MDATAWAQSAMYDATHPLIQATTAAPGGETASSAVVAKARARSTGIAGSASAFAGMARIGSAANWNQRIGAVTIPQAVEIATTGRSARGSGYPSRRRMIGGATVKIAATAANDSWKPGSKTRYGFHARSATAPSRRTYHASRSLPVNHATDATAPAI